MKLSDLSILTRLSKIGVAISAENNLDLLLENIVKEACTFFNTDGGTLYLIEQDKLVIRYVISNLLDIKANVKSKEFDFEPIPKDPSFVSAFSAINKTTVNIDDIYSSDNFDFRGPKNFDKKHNYKTKSMLVTPLLDNEQNVIGVLQLVNAFDDKKKNIVPFKKEYIVLAESLASLAAISIKNSQLLIESEKMFESLLRVMIIALDARSQYTHGHVERVSGLTIELANAINEYNEGKYADFKFTPKQIKELAVAGWLHDIGKIVSPVHIMDKSTRLETIFDKIELITERFKKIAATIRCRELENIIKEKLPDMNLDEINKKVDKVYDALNFLKECNDPTKVLKDEDLEKIDSILRMDLPEDIKPILTDNEIENITIKKGTLTEKELQTMRDHIVVTQIMLKKISFPKDLKNVPLYAGSHHEMLDGSGYPDKLTEQDLPIQSRMLAIMDKLEAIIAPDRPYKRKNSIEKAMQILKQDAQDGKIDKDLLDIIEKKDVVKQYMLKEKIRRSAEKDYFVDSISKRSPE